LNYDIIKTNQTYLYYQGTPLYPFGYGLSYSTFQYSNLTSSTSVNANGTVTVSVDVTNTSSRAGDEVVQLYTHQRTSRDKLPLTQLRTFQRVQLAGGQTKTVRLTVPASDFRHWDVTRNAWVLESSVQDIMVGASSTDIREQTPVLVVGEEIPPRNLANETRAIDFDDYSGVQLVDETKVRGDAVGGSAGDWIKFTDADLGTGAARFTARVARPAAGRPSTIEIRLDSPTGLLVGTAIVTRTKDVYTYKTTTASLTRKEARGRHDVYLVFGGSDLRLASFSLR